MKMSKEKRNEGEWEPVLNSNGFQIREEEYALAWKCKDCGGGAIFYDDQPYRFCPWCGTKKKGGRKACE